MREIEILYQDEFLLALNKPSEIHSVTLDGTGSQTIAGYLQSLDPKYAEVAENPHDGGLVNRLDFPTSGVLLAAKNRDSWLSLRESSRAQEIRKCYFAIVDGDWQGPAVITTYLGSRYRRSKKVSIYTSDPQEKIRAKQGTTSFRKLIHERGYSIIEASLFTGQRHQVRAHAAHLGFPLTGDTLYGSTRSLTQLAQGDESTKEIPDLFLHAFQITLPHPVTGESLKITASLPRYLDQVISKDAQKLLGDTAQSGA